MVVYPCGESKNRKIGGKMSHNITLLHDVKTCVFHINHCYKAIYGKSVEKLLSQNRGKTAQKSLKMVKNSPEIDQNRWDNA